MTVQEFYKVIGSEYEDAARRLGNEAIIRKFVIKFSSDPSFKELESAFRQGNAEKAFRAAHTLKGVAVNLGFDALYKQTCELTEKLRGRTFDDTETLFANVQREYGRVIENLQSLE